MICCNQCLRALAHYALQIFLASLLIVDVGTGAKPLHDLSVLITHWLRAPKEPVISLILCAQKSILNLVRDAVAHGSFPCRLRSSQVFRMQDLFPLASR